MLFNTKTNGDPRSFMYYNGEYYINGTEVILNDDYINNHTFNGRQIWKYARFDHQTVYNGKNSYFFCATRLDWSSLNKTGLSVEIKKDYATYFIIEAFNVDMAIYKITKPIKLTEHENEAIKNYITQTIKKPKNDWDYPELRIPWIIYIVVMIGSLIFNQFYIAWIISSFIFFAWRKDILNQ